MLKGLEVDKVYQVSVVAVDGKYSIESDVEEIDTHITGFVSTLNLSTHTNNYWPIQVCLSDPQSSDGLQEKEIWIV